MEGVTFVPVPSAGRRRRQLPEPVPAAPPALARRAAGADRARRLPFGRLRGQRCHGKSQSLAAAGTAPADGAIPVFGEKNTVAWMLKKGLGRSYEVPDEQGKPVTLRIVGLLQDSVFQSELLMSEANFLKLYPDSGGLQLLPDRRPAGLRARKWRQCWRWPWPTAASTVTPTARAPAAVTWRWRTRISRRSRRWAAWGCCWARSGLAVVLLRSVWERRGELALLRALGFRRSAPRLAGAGGERLPAAAGPGRRHDGSAAGGGPAL